MHKSHHILSKIDVLNIPTLVKREVLYNEKYRIATMHLYKTLCQMVINTNPSMHRIKYGLACQSVFINEKHPLYLRPELVDKIMIEQDNLILNNECTAETRALQHLLRILSSH